MITRIGTEQTKHVTGGCTCGYTLTTTVLGVSTPVVIPPVEIGATTTCSAIMATAQAACQTTAAALGGSCTSSAPTGTCGGSSGAGRMTASALFGALAVGLLLA